MCVCVQGELKVCVYMCVCVCLEKRESKSNMGFKDFFFPSKRSAGHF